MSKNKVWVALFLLAGFVQALQAAEVKGDAKKGKAKTSMCMGCHGIDGYRTAFPAVYRVPKIGGQGAAYIVSALQAYKSKERTHGSMVGIAGSLSEQDMADLAAYYSQQKPVK